MQSFAMSGTDAPIGATVADVEGEGKGALGLAEDAARDVIERDIINEEIRWLEPRAHQQRLIALTAIFKLEAGRNFGISLSDANIILRIDAGGLAQEEGTLRSGDRIMAVNGVPVNHGDSIKEAIGSSEQVAFLIVRLATDSELPTRVAKAAAEPTGPIQPARAPADLAKEMKASVQTAVSDFARRFGKKGAGEAATDAVGAQAESAAEGTLPSDGNNPSGNSVGEAIPVASGVASTDGASPSADGLSVQPVGPPSISLPPPPPPLPPGTKAATDEPARSGVDLSKLRADVGKRLNTYFPTRRRSTSGQADSASLPTTGGAVAVGRARLAEADGEDGEEGTE